MPDCRIGFYVHHQGRGHANRTREIIKYLKYQAYVFGSDLSLFHEQTTSNTTSHTLPPDTSSTNTYAKDWPSILHYAPLGIRNSRKRTHTLARYFDEHNLDVLVVDVSVEVALLARLCGIPTIYSRQHGYRQDEAHIAAFQSATSLLAPYLQAWEEPETARWVQEKTFYAGGFSRFKKQGMKKSEAQEVANMSSHQQHVVVMSGFGGNDTYHQLEETARHNHQWQWWILGPIPPSPSAPSNLHYLGVKSNPYPYLQGADVVVASAGNNTVMELAEIKARYICIPEARPFDEQLSKARVLARKNAALVLPNWSSPSAWENHLRHVNNTNLEALHTIITPGAAQQAARHIEEVAETQRRNESQNAAMS